MYIKIHKTKFREIVALSDEDLLNKEFEEGDFQIKVSEHFYNGKIVTEKEATPILINADSLNIIGENSIALCMKLNLITKENILYIQNVPHAIAILR